MLEVIMLTHSPLQKHTLAVSPPTRAELLSRITINPHQLHGQPCIRGQRLPVTLILDALAAGDTSEVILSHHPTLTLEDIQAACAYASEVIDPNTDPFEHDRAPD